MKTIGLIWGMSWESSLEYYRLINQAIKERLGGHHSAEIILRSVDFEEIKTLQFQNRWDEAWALLAEHARRLEYGWAQMILLCTNTMHKVANEIEVGLSIPFIHIADGTWARIKEAWYQKVALLGTAFTMEQDFYKGRLRQKYWLDVVVPWDDDRAVIHNVIYNELCLWKVKDESRQEYIRIIKNLADQWCQCVILGCTEIGMLINESVSSLPVFDTTKIHAEYAVDMCLK